jgi:hypothetical protein
LFMRILMTSDRSTNIQRMNKKGHPETLVASHPGNTNAITHGVHSPRMIETRAAEIEAQLVESFELPPEYRVVAREVARNLAVLEAIDNHLSEDGLTDRRGKPRYLLEQRPRTSRLLGYWLEKLSPELERQRIAVKPQVGAPAPAFDTKRFGEMVAVAFECGLFADHPEIERQLEAHFVAQGWTPPPGQPSPESTDPSNDVPEPGEQKDDPHEGGDRAAPTSAQQAADGVPPPSDEPVLPPGTVLARAPSTQRRRRRP